MVELLGNQSNTFTGDVFISGYSGLSLRMARGKIGIRGNVYVSNNGTFTLDRGGQILKTSKVEIENSRFLLFNYESGVPINQSLRKLVVKGNSVVEFYSSNSSTGIRLDDLLIEGMGGLVIDKWKEGLHHLLVKKDSEHVQDALMKIKFSYIEGRHAGLQDYDKDYWQIIPAFPEPSTYGAIFGGIGSVLFTIRRRKVCARCLGTERAERDD